MNRRIFNHSQILRLLKLRVWLAERLRLGELQILIFWAGLVGLIGGVCSILFRKGIETAQWMITHQAGELVHIAENLPWWQRLYIPTLGGLIAGIVIHFGMRLAKGQSSTDYMEAIALKDGVIRSRSVLIKSLSSLMSIASGGSIGREGPMVQLAAMFASFLGRSLRFPTPRMRLLVACGAAAGIASAYNAPIAGALFVAEIIFGSIAMESFGPLIFSSVIATVTIHQFLGVHPVYEIPPFHFTSHWELIPYLFLGLLTGCLAPGFLRFLKGGESLFSRWKVPLYLRMAGGGLVVGAISISQPGVWGNGFSEVSSILLNEWAWKALVFLLVMKLLATTASVGSGAVGGVFTPTLFMGAAVGCLWGKCVHFLFPLMAPEASAYALVGMGCFLAGTTHAPLMAILMLFEMTLDYAIVLPLMLGCVTAYYTSHSLNSHSIYSEVLRRKREQQPETSIDQIPVRDLMKPNPLHVMEKARFSEIAETFVKNRSQYLYVTDEKERFLGAISLHDIKRYLSNTDLATLVIAGELYNENFPVLFPENTLHQALESFSKYDGEWLPVIKEDKGCKLVGNLSKSDLLLTMLHGRHTGNK